MMDLSINSNHDTYAAEQEQQQQQASAEQHMFSNKSIPYLIEESIRICMDIEDVDSVLASTITTDDRTAILHCLIVAMATIRQ